MVLDERVRLLGNDHPLTSSARGFTARRRWWTGDPSGAATELEGVIADRALAFDAGLPGILGDLVALALIWASAGEQVKAEAALDRALAADEGSRSLDPSLVQFVQEETSVSRRTADVVPVRALVT